MIGRWQEVYRTRIQQDREAEPGEKKKHYVSDGMSYHYMNEHSGGEDTCEFLAAPVHADSVCAASVARTDAGRHSVSRTTMA